MKNIILQLLKNITSPVLLIYTVLFLFVLYPNMAFAYDMTTSEKILAYISMFIIISALIALLLYIFMIFFNMLADILIDIMLFSMKVSDFMYKLEYKLKKFNLYLSNKVNKKIS